MTRGSLLPEGVALEGEIRGAGDLAVAGTVNGPIDLDGQLTIERSGIVRGQVRARSIVVRGALVGPAIADDVIRLEPGARMVGDARAERVSVLEGAMLRGRIAMTGAQAARRSAAGTLAAASASSSGAEPVARGGEHGRGAQIDAGPVADPDTARFVRPDDLTVGRGSLQRTASIGAEARAPRGRPPEPVIPGVGRQRARRKDRGAPP